MLLPRRCILAGHDTLPLPCAPAASLCCDGRRKRKQRQPSSCSTFGWHYRCRDQRLGQATFRRGRDLQAHRVQASAQSLYDILGVSQAADAKAIKKAFKQRALKLHPDVNKAANAAERFQECKLAYQTLIDAAAREKYNRELRDGKPGGLDWDNLWSWNKQQGQQAPKAQKPAQQAEEPFYGFSDFFRDVSADWDTARRKRAARGTPTGSLWQELAGLGEDFVEFLEVELARSSDPELRRQAQASAAQSSAAPEGPSSSSQSATRSTGWQDPSPAEAESRAAQIVKDNEERKKRANDEVEDMLADMKRKLGLKDKA